MTTATTPVDVDLASTNLTADDVRKVLLAAEKIVADASIDRRFRVFMATIALLDQACHLGVGIPLTAFFTTALAELILRRDRGRGLFTRTVNRVLIKLAIRLLTRGRR